MTFAEQMTIGIGSKKVDQITNDIFAYARQCKSESKGIDLTAKILADNFLYSSLIEACVKYRNIVLQQTSDSSRQFFHNKTAYALGDYIATQVYIQF